MPNKKNKKPVIAVYIDAGNDRNGNPRRGWACYDRSGTLIRFIDEGYQGTAALALAYPHFAGYDGVTGKVKITPAQYREFLKFA